MDCQSSPLAITQDNNSSDKTSNPSSGNQELEQSDLAEMSLEEIIVKGSEDQFQVNIYQISEVIQFGNNQKLLKCKILHLKLLKLFYNLYKKIDSDKADHEELLFVISLLAEVLRKNSSIKLPFSKKTVLGLLAFDPETLEKVKGKNQIMTVLAILLENMSKQGRLMVRLGVQEQLKQGLLLLISKTDEFSVLQILLRALLELQAKTGYSITPKELDDGLVTRQVRDIFGDNAAFTIRSLLCRPKARTIKTLSNMTLIELVSQR